MAIPKTFPQDFLLRLEKILPQRVRFDQVFGPVSQKAFRVNTLKADVETVSGAIAAQGIKCNPVVWYAPAFTVNEDDSAKLMSGDLVTEGKIYAQGLESMLAAIVLDPKPHDAVLDLCAAPGSKTTLIAALMQNQGEITANEPIRDRFFRLKAVVELMGAKVKFSSKDGRFLRSSILYDRILVDAPCSSEGRFNMLEPKSFQYWSLRKINEMAHKQKGLLQNAARLLKPGGVMVYSTCTFAPEENEEVVHWFLRKNPGQFTIEPLGIEGIAHYPPLSGWGKKIFSEEIKNTFRVLPQGAMQGFFIAKFRRTSDG